MDVAFICTGNICRSPMAEVLLRARLATVAPDVIVGSAGLMFDGRAAERHAVRVMAKQGLDLSSHSARKISLDLLDPTSVIIGMERRHVREVTAYDSDFFPRSFTLPELVHATSIVGPRPADVDLRTWVEHLGSLRARADYALSDPASEVVDPMGGRRGSFRACAQTIDQYLASLVALAWPDPTPSDTAVAPSTSGGTHADRDRR